MDHIAPDLRSTPARIFWDGCARSVLLMPRCTGCSRLRWYLQTVCPWCWTAAVEWVPMSGYGTVYSFTVVERAFDAALKSWVPYVPALIELDESSDFRFVSRVVGCPVDDVSVGMPVEVTFERVSDNLVLPYFCPRPARNDGADV